MRILLLLLPILFGFYHSFSQQNQQEVSALVRKVQALLPEADRKPIIADSLGKIYLEEAIANQDKIAEGTLRQMFASLELGKGNTTACKEQLEKAKSIFEEINYDPGLSIVYRNYGNLYSRNQLDSARYFFELFLEKATLLQDSVNIPSALNSLGNIDLRKAEYGKALDYYLKAAVIQEARDDMEGLPRTYSGIGSVYIYMKKPEEARQYLQKAFDLFEEQDSDLGIAGAGVNLGAFLLDQGKYEAAIPYLSTAYKNFGRLGISGGQAVAAGNLAKAYGNLDSIPQAMEMVEVSLKAAQQSGNARNQISNLLHLADLKRRIKAFQEAIPLFQESVGKATAFGDQLHRQNGLKGLAYTYADLGQFDSAYFYHVAFVEVKDSIFSQKNDEYIAELQLAFENEQKETLIAEQKLEISQQRNTEKNLWIAGIIAILLVGGSLQFLRYRDNIGKKEAEFQLAKKEAEAQKLQEIDEVKSRFFTSISHEFRTPLTLILGPLQRFIAGELKMEARSYFQMMYRNADRLLQLVNQLLDLARMQSGKLELHAVPGDIFACIRANAMAFHSLAESLEIAYEVQIPNQALVISFDQDKLEKAINNLLSNAFKFSESKGKVSCIVTHLESQQQLKIEVVDDGIGISTADQELIFDHFYRVNDLSFEGSGIGLAHTRELVQLHGGSISVMSSIGEGSTFTIFIPAIPTNDSVVIPAYEIIEKGLPDRQVSIPAEVGIDTHAPLILIVEDHADVRSYIKDILGSSYQLLMAGNGKEGLEIAKTHIPDLIISDVMMPEMDGNTFTFQLKNDERTSHIPVILLTAKSGQDAKLEGLETGADAFLTKPFDTQELRTRVHHLITQRKSMQARFAKEIYLKPSEIAVTSADERFLHKLMQIVENEMEDERFSVEKLGKEVGMSRSQLHRKIKALTQQTPSVFIRSMRLKRAKDLLEQQAGTAAEISYLVGFGSPAYFNKCFKDHFGFTPGSASEQKVN